MYGFENEMSHVSHQYLKERKKNISEISGYIFLNDLNFIFSTVVVSIMCEWNEKWIYD